MYDVCQAKNGNFWCSNNKILPNSLLTVAYTQWHIRNCLFKEIKKLTSPFTLMHYFTKKFACSTGSCESPTYVSVSCSNLFAITLNRGALTGTTLFVTIQGGSKAVRCYLHKTRIKRWYISTNITSTIPTKPSARTRSSPAEPQRLTNNRL